MAKDEKRIENLLAENQALRVRAAESDRLRLALEAAERVLSDREQRLETIIRAIPALFFDMNREGRYLRVNTVQESSLVANANDLLGHRLHEFFEPEQADAVVAAIQQALDMGTPGSVEYFLRVPAGDLYFEGLIAPLVPGDKNHDEVIFVALDITSRKHAEMALAENEHKFRLLYEDAPMPYQSLDEKGNILEVNRAWLTLTGYEKDAVIGTRIWDYLTPESKGKFKIAFREFKQKGEVTAAEFEMVKADGTPILVSVSGKNNRDTFDESSRTHCILRDITHERMVEKDLRRSEEQFRQLAENIKEVYWLRDTESEAYIYVSPAFEELWGVSAENLLTDSNSLMTSVHPDDRDYIVNNFPEPRAETSTEIEFRIIRPDNSMRWVYLRSFPVRNPSGKVYRTAGIVRDITERKAKEEALKTAADIVHAIPTGLFLLQFIAPDNLILLDGNNQALLNTGIDIAPYIGKELTDIWPNPKGIPIRQAIQQTHETGESVDIPEFAYDDGVTKGIFHIHVFNLPDDRMGVAVENITKQIETATAERHQRSLAAALVETSETINTTLDYDEVLERILNVLTDVVPHDGANIMMLDPITDRVNVIKSCPCYEENQRIPAYARSYSLEEAPHLAHILASGQPLVIAETQHYKGWITNEEGKHIRSYAGAAIMLEGMNIGLLSVDSATPNFFTEQHAADLKAFASQASIAVSNARMYKALMTYSENLQKAVSERTTELKALNEELNSLSALKDEFVSNISHELNSPVTSLKIQMHLLGLNPEGLSKYLPIMRREVERLEHTIKDLLQLSRMDQGRLKWEIGPLDVNELILQVLEDRMLLVQQNRLTLTTDIQPKLPIIQADGGLIGQVFSILLSNALTYTPPGGAIVVRSSGKKEGGKQWVGFTVNDNGPGIPPEDQPRLFERFTRGRDVLSSGKPGTGLGLALAREIIEGHQGRIELESTGIPGEGSTFTVWLPAKKT